MNSENGISFERKDFTKEIARKAAVRIIALAILLGLIYSMMTDESVTGVAKKVVNLILPPVAMASIVLVVALLVNLLFDGYMVQPISTSLMVVSLATFMCMQLYGLSRLMDNTPFLSSSAIFIAVVAVAVAIYIPLKTWAWHLSTPLSSGITLVLVVVFYLLYSGILIDFLLIPITVVVSVVAVIKLLSTFGRHSDPDVRKKGKFIGSGKFMAIAVTLTLFIVIFFGWLWPEARSMFPEQATLIFWIAICIMLAICGLALALYLKSEGLDKEFETWGIKINDIVGNDPELASASAAIREFVDEGRKDGLIVKMMTILVSNGVGEEASKRVIHDIIVYREPIVPAALVTSIVDTQAEARAERERRVVEMLKSAAGMMRVPGLIKTLD